jgi:hypothetical protein
MASFMVSAIDEERLGLQKKEGIIETPDTNATPDLLPSTEYNKSSRGLRPPSNPQEQDNKSSRGLSPHPPFDPQTAASNPLITYNSIFFRHDKMFEFIKDYGISTRYYSVTSTTIVINNTEYYLYNKDLFKDRLRELIWADSSELIDNHADAFFDENWRDIFKQTVFSKKNYDFAPLPNAKGKKFTYVIDSADDLVDDALKEKGVERLKLLEDAGEKEYNFRSFKNNFYRENMDTVGFDILLVPSVYLATDESSKYKLQSGKLDVPFKLSPLDDVLEKFDSMFNSDDVALLCIKNEDATTYDEVIKSVVATIEIQIGDCIVHPNAYSIKMITGNNNDHIRLLIGLYLHILLQTISTPLSFKQTQQEIDAQLFTNRDTATALDQGYVRTKGRRINYCERTPNSYTNFKMVGDSSKHKIPNIGFINIAMPPPTNDDYDNMFDIWCNSQSFGFVLNPNKPHYICNIDAAHTLRRKNSGWNKFQTQIRIGTTKGIATVGDVLTKYAVRSRRDDGYESEPIGLQSLYGKSRQQRSDINVSQGTNLISYVLSIDLTKGGATKQTKIKNVLDVINKTTSYDEFGVCDKFAFIQNVDANQTQIYKNLIVATDSLLRLNIANGDIPQEDLRERRKSEKFLYGTRNTIGNAVQSASTKLINAIPTKEQAAFAVIARPSNMVFDKQGLPRLGGVENLINMFKGGELIPLQDIANTRSNFTSVTRQNYAEYLHSMWNITKHQIEYYNVYITNLMTNITENPLNYKLEKQRLFEVEFLNNLMEYMNMIITAKVRNRKNVKEDLNDSVIKRIQDILDLCLKRKRASKKGGKGTNKMYKHKQFVSRRKLIRRRKVTHRKKQNSTRKK